MRDGGQNVVDLCIRVHESCMSECVCVCVYTNIRVLFVFTHTYSPIPGTLCVHVHTHITMCIHMRDAYESYALVYTYTLVNTCDSYSVHVCVYDTLCICVYTSVRVMCTGMHSYTRVYTQLHSSVYAATLVLT